MFSHHAAASELEKFSQNFGVLPAGETHARDTGRPVFGSRKKYSGWSVIAALAESQKQVTTCVSRVTITLAAGRRVLICLAAAASYCSSCE